MELDPRDAGPELSKTEFTELLGQLGASAGALACKRVAGIKNLAEFQLELRTFQHRVATLIDEMEAVASAAPMAMVLPNPDDDDCDLSQGDRLSRARSVRRRQQDDLAIA
jgi:hypothetical protein